MSEERKNRPFPSCLVPLFQSEAWCIVFHMKMSFHSHADKTRFHMKGFARSLALKKRHTIRKWPVVGGAGGTVLASEMKRIGNVVFFEALII